MISRLPPVLSSPLDESCVCSVTPALIPALSSTLGAPTPPLSPFLCSLAVNSPVNQTDKPLGRRGINKYAFLVQNSTSVHFFGGGFRISSVSDSPYDPSPFLFLSVASHTVRVMTGSSSRMPSGHRFLL